MVNKIRERNKRIVRRRKFEDVTQHLNDRQFKEVYRMSREAFDFLLSIYRTDISSFDPDQEEEEEEVHRKGNVTMAATRLAIFLRMLAGGSAYDIMLAYDVGRSSVYSIMIELIDITVYEKKMDLIRMPRTE